MKQPYTAPKLTVVSFKVERGFEGSLDGAPLKFDFVLFDDDEDLNQAAGYSESNWTW